VYAVPGDPTFGEATVTDLRTRAREAGLRFEIAHGVSFVEPCLNALGLDALDGLSIADALDLARRHHPSFEPDAPALVGQLYSRMVAADVKLTLLNQYPPDHPIRLIHQAATTSQVVEDLPLSELDRSREIGSLTALYIPALDQPSGFAAFQEIVAHLRAPEGCPWDREQTHQSLRTNLMEETYEALQAIDEDDMALLKEELGDLMLQIVLQTQIAIESDEFTMADVLSGIRAKLIRRHPHIFGDLKVAGVDEVLHNWEALKAAEREAGGGTHGALDGVPAGLPALAQAAEIQSRVARLGFDWPAIDGVMAKVFEELDETLSAPDEASLVSEIGDLLFSVVNFARWRGVDPEAALRRANARFRRRFAHLEASSRSSGKPLSEMQLDEMDALWESAKGSES
jgi:tetrapyrrole methylase family protein/MazG family protein